ncbi:glutamate racemase [uncultured Helicobacter sp.]|uniref:glutamate racemase n=1 Tax=uncultured Helicobacter sp. TaxID=175537 RepID=UPI00258D7A71|nr:glutamate racemase [uncultured Helicobacter sp.]
MKLGIFDSGVGGLSVAKHILESKIFEEIIYFGDTARVPYGVKDKETIIKFSLEALEFFISHKVDMLIVACNTVSAYALESMRSRACFPIIGVIEPGVIALKNALPNTQHHILVLATKATINSNQYQHQLALNGYTNVKALATGLFVPIVEEGAYPSEILNASMHYYFHTLATKPNAIILGCTHFPLIADCIADYFENKSILIHSGEAIVEYLDSAYHLKPNQVKHTQIEFFASSDVEHLKSCAHKWCNIP